VGLRTVRDSGRLTIRPQGGSYEVWRPAFHNPPSWRRPYPELYQALLGQTVRAGELGYRDDEKGFPRVSHTNGGVSPVAQAEPQITDISTTERRIRISRRASGSGACRDSNHPVMPSNFCLLIVLSPNTFDRDGICCQRRSTVKR
jgi:hypothetical protein